MATLAELSLSPRSSTKELRTVLAQGAFVVPHGISDQLLDEAYGTLRDFFSSSREEKAAWVVAEANGQSGYLPPLVEKAERSSVPDWKELFHWGSDLAPDHILRRRFPSRYPESVWPDSDVSNMKSVLTALHSELLQLQLRVLEVIATSLKVSSSFFHDMMTEGPVVNRASWYPPMREAPVIGQEWATAHKDFDLITALPRATRGGLYVEVDAEWMAASAPDGYAVINCGMAMERLSNGAIPAALHKVQADDDVTSGRLSIVQFCHPVPWTILEPLTHNGWASPSPQFSTIRAQDLFERTMYRINRM